jgi:HAE1 family hydrophobic/amphiphilic exporter-1
MFINLKPRSERPPMKQVVEGLRKKVRDVPGINVFMRPVQNLQLGGRASKAQYQYILQSVQAGDLYDWATKAAGEAARRPDVPRRHQRRADARPAGQLKIDRDKANALGVPIEGIRSALFSAFGERQVSTIFTSVDSYQVIMEAARRHAPTKAPSTACTCGPAPARWCRCQLCHRGAHRGPHGHQPRRAAAGGDGVVQPGAGRGAGRRHRAHRRSCAPSCRPRSITTWGGDAAVFQSSQGSQAVLIMRRCW